MSVGRLKNPGPGWCYRWLDRATDHYPDWLYNALIKLGVHTSLLCMYRRRRYSKEYLRIVLGRRATYAEQYRHFHTFISSLIYKLRLGKAAAAPDFRFRMASNGCETKFLSAAKSREPMLFGTFHIGNSDLLGCILTEFGRRIKMVRQKVANDPDLDALKRTFGEGVDFVWINKGESMLFALRNAAEDGSSIALQCDREEHSSRKHPFDFLGARRLFPVTIYHLAYLFKMPVVFSFGIPTEDGETEVVASEIFQVLDGSKQSVLNAGYEHFQSVLNLLEKRLIENPYVWFNFCPLNTEVKGE